MNNSKTNHVTNNYNWLAERNGIAIAYIDEHLKFTLNSHAMLIFGVEQSSVSFIELSKHILRANNFKQFLEAISDKTSDYQLSVLIGGVEKKFLVSAIKPSSEKLRSISIQALDSSHNNAEYLCQYAINTNDAFALWTPDNQLIYLSQNFEKLFERARKVLKDNPFTVFEWVHPDDQVALATQMSNSDKINSGLLNIEFRAIMPDGRIKWVLYQKKALFDGSGKVYRILAVFTDITERKDVEQELIFSKTSVDQSFNPILWINKDAEVIYANPAACNSLEFTYEELLTKKIFEFDEITAEQWLLIWNNLKENKTDTILTRHITKNGKKVNVEIGANFLDFEGHEYVFAFVIDITERKKFEKQIQYSHDFEHLLFEISKRIITIPFNEIDTSINNALKEICLFTESDSTHIYRFNSTLESIELTHYYSKTNIKINDSEKIKLPVSVDSWHFKKLTSNKLVHIPCVSDLPEGDVIKKHCQEVEIGSFIDVALFHQDKVFGFFGITCKEEGRNWDNEEMQLLNVIGDMFMNALQKRDFMRELLDSEQNYREIYNATKEAIIIHNAETGKIEDVNNAMLAMYNTTYEKALSCCLCDLSSNESEDAREQALSIIHKALIEPQTLELLSKKSTGENFWTEVALKKADIHGQVKIIAVVRDISERKKNQLLLKENEAKYRMIVEGQSELIVRLDHSWKILFISPSFEKVFENALKEIPGKEFLSFVHLTDREYVTLAMKKLFNPPHTCFLEFTTNTVNGQRWFAWNFTAVKNEPDEPLNFIGVGRDITYQKMVESAMRESEDRFRSIVQNLSDVVFLIDEKANIKYVTPSCKQYLDKEVEELLGNNILNLIHVDDQWLAKENIALHLEGVDYSMPYEIRLNFTSDTWKVFEAKSQNLLNHAAVNSIIFTISDITDRKLLDKQVLEAIIKTEEKERERFAKDLHDDLGPLLSSIKMYVSMLNKVNAKEKQELILTNLQEIVKEAITTTKDVSNDLNPHVLNNYGLISALNLFIDKLSKDLNIIFEEQIGDVRYSTAIELSLYRIIKELINNTIKHAKADTITLNIWEKGSNLNLLFADNGIGITEEAFKVKKPGGMGLSNIISRAKSLNAKHVFHTNLPIGFKFEMQIPLVQE
jgi:PAS domain S-box-containing protein